MNPATRRKHNLLRERRRDLRDRLDYAFWARILRASCHHPETCDYCVSRRTG